MSHVPSKAMLHAAPHHDDHHEPAAPHQDAAPTDTVEPAPHAGQAGRADPGASPAKARAATIGSAAAWVALGAGVIAATVAAVRRFTPEPQPPRPAPKPKRKRKAKHD